MVIHKGSAHILLEENILKVNSDLIGVDSRGGKICNMLKLNAKQLRSGSTSLRHRGVKRNEIYIILDDVLDTYNIGSVFRLADAVGAKKVYLCKGSATPPNSRIKKASINTTEWVEWEYAGSTIELIQKLQLSIPKLQTVAIEQDTTSVPYDKFEYKLPLLLIVGNETTGISPEVLSLCDAIVELPMFGVNISLNVMVSLGVVLYQAIEIVGL